MVYLILKKDALEKAKKKCTRLYYILMCRLPTYGAQYGAILLNETRLANAVSLIPIKQSALTDTDKRIPFRISRKGPGYTYSGDCVEAKFAANSVCMFYLEDETKRVVMDCHLVKGDAEDHVMFNPVAAVQLVKLRNGRMAFKMLNKGQYSTPELGEVISSAYNDSEIKVPDRRTDVMLMKSDQDRKNVVPRSSMTLAYGVSDWPSYSGL